MLAAKHHEGPAPSHPRPLSYAYPSMSSLRSSEKAFELPLRKAEPDAVRPTDNATARALDVPELLQAILDCCSPHTLLSCARVNSHWCRLAVQALWHGDSASWEFDTASMPYASSLVPYPSIWQLEGLAPDRLAYYLGHARLFLCHTHNCPSDSQVRYPNWSLDAWSAFAGKALRLDSDTAWKYLMKDEGHLRLLHTELRALQCPRSWTANCTPVLNTIANNCHRLTWLQIRIPSKAAEPTAAPAFVAALGSISSTLRALQITFEHRQPSQILPAIFALPRLEFLSFEEFGPDAHSIPYLSWLPEFDQSFSPPPLRLLRAHATYESLPHYLARLPLLQDLELLFPSPADFRAEGLVTALQSCPGLSSLNVLVHPECFIPPDTLPTIASTHPQLREVLLHCGKQGRLPYLTPWPTGTVAQLAMHLPLLDKLRLEYHMELASDELIQLGQSCPLLRELRLSADAVLKPLAMLPADHDTIFPTLEVLRVDSLLYSRKPVRTDILRPLFEGVVARHLPRVHTLGNFGPDAHDYNEIELGRRGTRGLALPGRRWLTAPRRVASVGDEIWREIWHEAPQRWTTARSQDDGYISYGSRG